MWRLENSLLKYLLLSVAAGVQGADPWCIAWDHLLLKEKSILSYLLEYWMELFCKALKKTTYLLSQTADGSRSQAPQNICYLNLNSSKIKLFVQCLQTCIRLLLLCHSTPPTSAFSSAAQPFAISTKKSTLTVPAASQLQPLINHRTALTRVSPISTDGVAIFDIMSVL